MAEQTELFTGPGSQAGAPAALPEPEEPIGRLAQRIRAKCLLAAERGAKLSGACTALADENASLRRSLAAMEAEAETLRAELLCLRMSAAVAPTREDRDRLRDLLTELTREIDKCIADLSR